MNPAEIIFLSLLGAALALNFLAAWRARIFIRNSPVSQKIKIPPFTVIIPVRGMEGDGKKHFERFLNWEAPSYQVLFAVQSDRDPAVEILRELRGKEGCEVGLNVGGTAEGGNPKIQNLMNAWEKARHDWIMICDADLEPDAHLPMRMFLPLLESSSVGMTHALYRRRDGHNLASSWENVWINCDFWAQGLLSDWIRKTDFAFGAAMAFHRSTLESIGGWGVLKDYLADDFQLGNRIARSGKELRFGLGVVTLSGKEQGWAQTWRHLLRWSRTIRVCQPSGFAGSLILNVTFFALLLGLVFPQWGWVSGLAVLTRMFLAHQCRNGIMGESGFWREVWLVPFKDLAQVILWVSAFGNGKVEWRGQQYRLRPDGKLDPL